MKTLLLSLTTLVVFGCVTSVRGTMPPPTREWVVALERAKSSVADGHYDDADRTLYSYAQQYAGTPEAHEATYWRGVFKLDPKNRGGSASTASEHLDEYLSDTSAATLHRMEAITFLRLASSIDSIGKSHIIAATASDAQRTEDAEKAKQREEELQKEIQRLKDQLDKTTQELDRIKKRLTDKNPPQNPTQK